MVILGSGMQYTTFSGGGRVNHIAILGHGTLGSSSGVTLLNIHRPKKTAFFFSILQVFQTDNKKLLGQV